MISPEGRPRIWGATGRIQGLRQRVTVELQRAGEPYTSAHRVTEAVELHGAGYPSPPRLQKRAGDSH